MSVPEVNLATDAQFVVVASAGVDPLIYMTDEVNVMREDEPKITLTQKEALKNAPKKDSDYFKVPKVIDNH